MSENSEENSEPSNLIRNRLHNVLQLSKRKHKTEILNQPDLKNAHIYCKINQLSGQVSGPLIESFIQQKYSMTKNNSSDCIGDLCHNGVNLEIKVSIGGKDHNKFNYVQLRMNHICDYLLTAYYISEENVVSGGELFIFKLNKENMKNMIIQYGGYAHGTVQKLGAITEEDLSVPDNDKEYAIRPKFGDKCWNELLRFRIQEI